MQIKSPLTFISVSPIYLSWLFEVVSVSVALYTTHLVRHLPSSGHEFLCRQLHSSNQVIKFANFVYKKNCPFSGPQHL